MIRLTCLLSCLLLPGLSRAADAVPAHPLDPLTEAEIESAVALLKAGGKVNDACWMPWISRHEPPKAEVLAFKPGSPVERKAFVLVHRRPDNRVFEAVVDLTAKKVASWVEKKGVHAPSYDKDFQAVSRLVKAHPKWLEGLKARGLDPDEVFVWCWSPGPEALAAPAGAQVVLAEAAWTREPSESDARPVEGLSAVVNLTTEKVLEVRDSGPVPMPTGPGYRRGKTGQPPRPAPKPLTVTLPKGPDFEVKGQEVTWQNWRFRFAADPREGLVLYTVAHKDNGNWRPVLYRGSVTELFVPYGDPSPDHRYRMYFDVGDWGLAVGPLEAGTDAPAHATFFDVRTADSRGRPKKVENAVALYERDGGVLWRHAFYLDGGVESRRGRQLVLLTIASVGNYDYGFEWVFHQDGTLEAQVLLTGIMAVKATAAPQSPGHGGNRFGHAVDAERRLIAMHHQHFFNYRLDLDVDGPFNRVFERNVEVPPIGPDNPAGNAFVIRETPLMKEGEAKRRLNLESSRHWLVANPARKNALRDPTGYLLVPRTNAVPHADPKSLARRRAGFLDAHLWVTPYDAAERYAAGDYVSQGGDGLPRWAARDRDLTEADVVLWYTLGVTHLARPEEWPVMPVSRAGFKLAPCGFFDRNPAVDLPK